MNWYEITDQYHSQSLKSAGDLNVLAEEWQRELAALWRLEADVNNGGYLQFIENWGLETSRYAIAGLNKIGARNMANLIEECQQLVTKYTDSSLPERERTENWMPNRMINLDGSVWTPPPSPLPEAVQQKIDDLCDLFMDYPDDIATLGLDY